MVFKFGVELVDSDSVIASDVVAEVGCSDFEASSFEVLMGLVATVEVVPSVILEFRDSVIVVHFHEVFFVPDKELSVVSYIEPEFGIVG